MGRAHVRIRPAEPGDIPALTDLARGEGVVLVPGGTRQMQSDALDQLPQRLLELLADPSRRILVAVLDELDEPDAPAPAPSDAKAPVAVTRAAGHVVGMALVCEDRMNDFVSTTVLRLGGMTVLPKHRRRGAGRALLAAVVHIAEERSVEYVVTSVATRSRDSNRYLARLGFVPMVSRRVASTAVLRRSLGLPEGERMAVRRRAMIARSPRGVVRERALRRGA